MKYYYQFRAVILGSHGVGVRSTLRAIDPQCDANIVQLQDKISETLYIYEFCRDEIYLQDALCFVVICDQSEKSIQFARNKIQIILKQLNRTYQFAILVSNKIDQSLTMQDELESFCATNQVNFIGISAKMGTNVQLLSNLLRIKAQLIMKKCAIEPFELESHRETAFGSIGTPDRPLPKTPSSSEEKENRSDYKSIRSETVESFRAVEILEDRALQSTQVTTKRAYLDIVKSNLTSSCRLKPNKVLMILEIEYNNQIYPIEVYQDDSYALIVERMCAQMSLKAKQQNKRNIISVIENQIESFIQLLAQQFQDKRCIILLIIDLKVKEQYEKFVLGYNSRVPVCKYWKNPTNAIGLIAILIQQQLIRIYVHKNDEPYDLAFNSIVDYNLKKHCIGALVNKIKVMQTNRNIKMLGFFDFTNHEFIVYNGECTSKKLYQYCMQHHLDYEHYQLLSSLQ